MTEPIRIASYEEFERTFGPRQSYAETYDAIEDFFSAGPRFALRHPIRWFKARRRRQRVQVTRVVGPR